jgi:hypothetical protein
VRPTRLSLSAVLVLALIAAACSASQTPGSTASAASTPTPTPTAAPTPTLKPLVAPDPTDIPVDGTCEQYQICLGLLKPGVTYHTQNFAPAFTFQVQSARWVNISLEVGDVQLIDIHHPGEVIAVFSHPRAADDNGLVSSVGDSVSDLAAWLQRNPKLSTTPAKKATLGGLSGVVLEARIADGVTDGGPADCPARVCVTFLRGSDPKALPPWNWDWGFAGTESARIFLLDSKAGVIAVLVDALDRTTYDSLNQAADGIFKTLKFN